MKLESPTSQSREKFCGKKKADDFDFTGKIAKFKPDYAKTYLAAEQAKHVMKSLGYDGSVGFNLDDSDFVGYKLLRLRMTDALERNEDVAGHDGMRASFEENFVALLAEADSRSHNYNQKSLQNLKPFRSKDENKNDHCIDSDIIDGNGDSEIGGTAEGTLDHWVRRSVRKRQWTAISPLAATSGGPMAGSGETTPKRYQPPKKNA